MKHPDVLEPGEPPATPRYDALAADDKHLIAHHCDVHVPERLKLRHIAGSADGYYRIWLAEIREALAARIERGEREFLQRECLTGGLDR